MTRNASVGHLRIHLRPVPFEVVPVPATGKTISIVRYLASTVGAAARQTPRPRALATVVGITVMLAVVLLVPLPAAVEMRDWAHSLGPWFPLAFFLIHTVVTVLPFPRTAFTLAAGLLLGPVLGVAIAVGASSASAVLAMLLVRVTGWRLNRLVRRPAMDRLDRQLRERGWLAILSLRFIPVVPFSVINYAAGASGVRPLPYTWATVLGLLPGTAAVVLLGNAVAGDTSPLMVVVSVGTGALGLAGLIFEVRQYRRHHRHVATDDDAVPEPAVAH